VVVAVSSVSYGSYLLLQYTKGSGIQLSAVLGGIYSSTVTTLHWRRGSTREAHPCLFSGSILLASGLHVSAAYDLIGIFNWNLMKLLIVPFIALALAAAVTDFYGTKARRPAVRTASPIPP